MIHSTSVVEPEAEVDESVYIGPFCYIQNGAVIKKGSKLKNHISVWSGIIIEEDCFIGPNVVFTNDLTPRAFQRKGPSGWLMTMIKKGASIGANSTILPVCIGDYAAIGAGSLVTTNIQMYSLAVGSPARFKYYICSCNKWGRLIIDDINEVVCTVCKKTYPELYNLVSREHLFSQRVK